ncbi:GNAT family N-acetyltransferase [Saccharothrix obliqua]|uniref:GNAT family N-acetyltransferase n=1 Tax=Saccharothrix obliqua TaxID=2861747 RepID=UPI001C5FFBA1|nr:GNAT family N-acetyltransferase [Saccharothrix obliqua]MBW4720560.1 GNAT family N-acetyltransferase [Saccharothrix obliqua]
MVDVVKHDDLAGFWALTSDFYNADPVFHTVPIAAVKRRLKRREPHEAPPVSVTVSDGGELVAAAIWAPPGPVALSGVPARWADAVALGFAGHELTRVHGPRESAEAFVMAWAARTGHGVREVMALRLYRLAELTPPTGVRGTHRLATEDDVDLLVRWYMEFTDESTVDEPDEAEATTFVRGTMAVGAGHTLWLDDGEPVSWAGTGAPASGMSRIGPVYTPPRHRRRGYAAAVTAQAAAWGLDQGAEHVVLFTDLANPTANAIYQSIGFRPVYDAAEYRFIPPA